MKTTIWSNTEIFSEEDIEDMRSNYDMEDYSDSEIIDMLYEQRDDNLEYIRDEMPKTKTDIIAIADLGLWYGRRMGYKIIGIDISKCFYGDEDYFTWYVERGNLKCEASHHDGTNYILYRKFKENLSETQIDNFCDKIYYGKATKADISRYTVPIGKQVLQALGFVSCTA